ncbi:MAG: hypothetical protein L3J09_00270 [Flavobacteriaceae bacterium]|nr:hypothetical protein [Flavobacteriaceae bacterium]
MMLKVFVISLFFTLGLYSQEKKPIFNKNVINKEKKFNNDKNFTLVIVSSPKCGFCKIALKNIYSIKGIEELNIIVYSYEGEKLNKKAYQKTPYFNSFIFVDAEKDTLKLYDKFFFPRFYLYKKDDLIWKEKGYGSRTVPRIKRRLNKI